MNYNFINIEIKITFENGVIFNKNPFDGVLAYLYVEELKKEGKYEKYENKLIDLPFVKKTKSVYHTSYPIIENNEAFIENNVIVKSFDKKLYNKIGKEKKEAIDIQRGKFKSDVINYEKRIIKKIKFYVCGDIDKIESLLKNFTHYGKKSSLNFGKVKEIRLKEIKKDKSIEDNGIANRILPIKDFPTIKDGKKAFKRPIYPYFVRDNMVECYI